MKQIVIELTKGNNVRENLSNLRKMIKEESELEKLKVLLEDKKY